jgi:DNA primase
LKQAGLDVVVAKIPSRYKDPDEFAMADPAGWEASVRGATDVWSFMIDVLFAKHEGLSGSQKAKIGVEAARILSRIPDEIERIHHAKNVAERLGVPYEVIAKRVGPGYYASPSGSLGSHHSGKVEEKDRRMLLEERLLALAFSSEPRLLTDRGLVEHIQTPLPKKIVQFYLDYVADGGEWDMSVFGRELPSELFEGFASMVTLEEDEVDAKLELVQVERELREFVLKARIVDLTRAIGEYERMGDEEKLLAAQRELSKLSSELSSLTEEMP